MLVVGCISLVVGVILFFAWRRQKNRSFSLKSARPVTTADLQTTAAAIAAEIGGGSWRDYVRLRGTVQTDQTLISELAERACAYYTYKVVQEYETTRQEKDSQGRAKTVTKRESETISSGRRSVPFTLTDQMGQVWVDPDGADIETIQVVNEFLPGEPRGGYLSMGRFSRAMSTQPTQDQRLLGYRFTESILPVDQVVSVVGSVSDQSGVVTIKKPLQPDHHYLIALKTDEDLIADSDRSIQRLFWGMIGSLALGILLIIARWLFG